MKALAKRCLCPKPDLPDYFPFPLGAYQHPLYRVEGSILHFKVATTECSRCGIPLCEDCEYTEQKLIKMQGGGWDTYRRRTGLCPTCSEEGQ